MGLVLMPHKLFLSPVAVMGGRGNVAIAGSSHNGPKPWEGSWKYVSFG